MRLAARALVGTLVLVGALCSPAVAGAATRVVDDDRVQCPTAPFTTIQAAVTAAAPGDTVLVCDGVYPEKVTISKSNLRLLANVVQAAIIQAPPAGAPDGIVQVTGAGVSGVEVSRFVIQKGATAGSAPFGIQVDGGASLKTARHNLIRRIELEGIFVMASTAPDISYNTIQEYGTRAISVTNPGASATMSFNTLVGQPSSLSGILIVAGARGSAVGNRIVGNGGIAGIEVNLPAASGVSLKGNQVFDNVKGIRLVTTQGALVASNRVSRNTLEGIHAEVSSSGNTFDRNDARSNGGPDCRDDTMGSGTAGTANAWTFNRGIDPVPPGICTP